MIAKEKAIFWILLPVMVATIAIGINLREKKMESADKFLKDIESVTAKAKAKNKAIKDNWDIEGLKKQDASEDYSTLTERSIFFRPVSEVKPENKGEVISLKEEEPSKPALVYKGRMMVGPKAIVIIQDQNTGKSFSVKEGDAIGDFTVLSIEEKEIRFKKKDGEEIAITTIKEDNKKVTPQKEAEGIK